MKEIIEKQPNVTEVRLNGRKFIIVGTAHVSKASSQLVEETIRAEAPDNICLELCASRFQNLKNPDSWKNTDIFEVIKSGKAYLLLAQLALSSFQKRLAKEFGIQPGEEMHTGIRLSEELNIPLSLIDRDVKVTLKRAWSKAGFWGVSKIIASLFASIFSNEKISEAEIEKMKSGDSLTALMNEFSDALPGVKASLIDERDKYMAGKLLAVPGNTVLAVVGAGHVPGIKQIFGDAVNIDELETLPKSSFSRLTGWLFPILLAVIVIYVFFTAGFSSGAKLFGIWALANGAGASLGAVISLAHPLTILTAFISAPFAAIHPLIAVGWICALVEAFLNKPTVSDMEAIADDINSLRGIYRNGVSRIFLIMILTNLGSIFGTAVGLWLASRFS